MRPAIRKKKKKKVSATQSLCCSTTDTLGSYRGLNQSEIVKCGPPLWLAMVQILLYWCVCAFEDACAAAVRQRQVSSIDARSSFSEFDLFSERLTVTPGFCDRWIYRKIKQSPLFSKLPQILHLDASFDVIAMRFQSKKGCFSVQKMEWTALRSLHARFTRAASDKRTESGTNPRYSFGLQTVYLLGPARGLLSITRHRYTQRWEIQWSSRIHRGINNISVKFCEKHSNSPQNYVKATDIEINSTDVETRRNIVQ